jgi:hypothetical protein
LSCVVSDSVICSPDLIGEKPIAQPSRTWLGGTVRFKPEVCSAARAITRATTIARAIATGTDERPLIRTALTDIPHHAIKRYIQIVHDLLKGLRLAIGRHKRQECANTYDGNDRKEPDCDNHFDKCKTALRSTSILHDA